MFQAEGIAIAKPWIVPGLFESEEKQGQSE